MLKIDEEEALDRLTHAGRLTEDMAERIGLDAWTVDCAMALAFYALKLDDPKSSLESWLGLTESTVRVYGRKMPKWCDYETLRNYECIIPEGDDWNSAFMDAQDYLDRVIRLHFEQYGDIDGEVITEIGKHLMFGLAAAVMAYHPAEEAMADCRAIAERVLTFANESCEYREGRSPSLAMRVRRGWRRRTEG